MYTKEDVIALLQGVIDGCNSTSWYNGEATINRLIDQVGRVVKTTKIWYRDGECRVKLYHDGVWQIEADYFTNDKQDAEQTAAKMRGEL